MRLRTSSETARFSRVEAFAKPFFIGPPFGTVSRKTVNEAKKKAEAALRIELNDEAWERLCGYKSHLMPPKDGGRSVAVRVVSQFGEESTKVLRID